MENLNGVLYQVEQRLFLSRPEQPVPWSQLVLPSYTSDERAGLTAALQHSIDLTRTFLVEASAALQDHEQAFLTYIQSPKFEALSWYANDSNASKNEYFADLVLASLIDLAATLIPPYSASATVPPISDGGVEPLDQDELVLATLHYRGWFWRLHDLTARLVAAMQRVQDARNPVTETLLYESSSSFGLLDREALLGGGEKGLLTKLGGDRADAFVQKQQRLRIGALWYEMRDALYREGLSGVTHTTWWNIGGGDCFYASLAASVGLDGFTPDAELGNGDAVWLHNSMRDQIATQLSGGTGEDRSMNNVMYRTMVQTREQMRASGELDDYQDTRTSWYRNPITGSWSFRAVPLSDGPELGETRQQFDARKMPFTLPREVAEDPNRFTQRVDQAYQRFVKSTRIGRLTRGAAYWASTYDIRAAASRYQRRIHLYEIVNAEPGSEKIAYFKHVESHGNAAHRVACLAWTTENYLVGDPSASQSELMHFAAILTTDGGHPGLGVPLPDLGVLQDPFSLQVVPAPNTKAPAVKGATKRKPLKRIADQQETELEEYRRRHKQNQVDRDSSPNPEPGPSQSLRPGTPPTPPAPAPPPPAPPPAPAPADFMDWSAFRRPEQPADQDEAARRAANVKWMEDSRAAKRAAFAAAKAARAAARA